MAVIADEANSLCQLYKVDNRQDSHCKTDCSDDDGDSITSEDLQERINSHLFITRETGSGKVLWRCPIQNTDSLSDHVIAHDSLKYRFPAHSFRSMLLPTKENNSPDQSASWIQCCMRGLFFASFYEFNHCVAQIDTAFSFPQLVYRWFSNEDKLAADDDEKWAFYHGLNLVSKEDPLGWIVHQLMDDAQGEHFTSFLFQSVNIVKNHMGSCWDEQFGLYSKPESTSSKMKFEEVLHSHDQSFDEPGPVSIFCMSTESARAAINELFYGDFIKSPATVEELHQKLEGMTVDSNIDLFSFVQMIMKAYLTHMQKQFTLIRLMFETSCSGTLTDFYDDQVIEGNDHPKEYGDSLVGFRELHKILKTLWPNKISLRESTSIYHEAFDVMYPQSQWGKPCSSDGISFESFCIAADRKCLFSNMMRA